MWAYYAAGHTGIAVRFDLSYNTLQQMDHPFMPLQVNYSNEFPQVSYHSADRFDFIYKTLGTKAEAWKHEEEWRLVLIGRSGAVQVPPTMIDGVVFGLRTPPNIEAAVGMIRFGGQVS